MTEVAGMRELPPVETHTDDLAPPLLDVFVPGRPAPQGSKRYLGQAGGKGIMVESSKAVASWRADVRTAVLAVWGNRTPIDTAVAVDLTFVLPRPLSTPKRRTPDAIKKPDGDKIMRSVFDSLTGLVWRDDARIVRWSGSKRIAELGEHPGCRIVVWPVGAGAAT